MLRVRSLCESSLRVDRKDIGQAKLKFELGTEAETMHCKCVDRAIASGLLEIVHEDQATALTPQFDDPPDSYESDNEAAGEDTPVEPETEPPAADDEPDDDEPMDEPEPPEEKPEEIAEPIVAPVEVAPPPVAAPKPAKKPKARRKRRVKPTPKPKQKQE